MERRRFLRTGTMGVFGGLAGCAWPEDGSEDAYPTPADPEAVLPEGAEESLPPGVGPEGVERASELAERHHAALVDASFTAETRRLRTTYDDGGQLAEWGDALRVDRVAAGGSPVRVDYRLHGAEPFGSSLDTDTEWWSDDDSLFFRFDREGTAEYRHREPFPAAKYTGRAVVEPLFTNAPLLGVERLDDRTLAWLGFTSGEGGAGNAVRATGVADERGTFESVWRRFGYPERDRWERVVAVTDFLAVGETSVERPEWYDEAVAATVEA